MVSPTIQCHDALHAEVAAFLGASGNHGEGVDRVERIETHGAFVFLAGEHVYKIKRPVRYAYMDFSTLERRHRACLRELEVNRGHARGLYLGVVAITREADGRLAIGGQGPPVEWTVHMRRFDSDALLSQIAERQGIDAALSRQVADVVHAYHRGAPVDHTSPPVTRLKHVLHELEQALAEPALCLPADLARHFQSVASRRLDCVAAVLEQRAAAGHVRRCHGDLHLGNIAMWEGRPTLFDAIEFDEELATIDTLYDLAFLMMDLDQRGQRSAANVVLNRYLWRSQERLDLAGLAGLPLFLALRAAIRALVLAQRAALADREDPSGDRAAAGDHLRAALSYLQPAPARLIAIGGLSGTGKSKLAAAMAPRIGAAPGALHLRSDLERKALFGVEETARLPETSYSAQVNAHVYDRLLGKARTALAAGHAVVVDAVFMATDERSALEQIARESGVPMTGLWLTAPEATLLARVAARRGDASDATPDVVRRQLQWLHGAEAGKWLEVEAGGKAEATRDAAEKLLRLPEPAAA